MTRIRTDEKIRENSSDPCHPCSLQNDDFYPGFYTAQHRLVAVAGAGEGAAPGEALRKKGAGVW